MKNQGIEGNGGGEDRPEVFGSCPHCGAELSPWERILLSVDRALMCRHCWYRIILDLVDSLPPKDSDEPPKGKGPSK